MRNVHLTHTQEIATRLALEVSNLPHAICVDCHWKAINNTGHFHTGKSHGGNRGYFCANQAECTARLTNRSLKPVEHDTAPKFVCLDRDALLRSNPCLSSSTNGAQAQEGDQVLVLNHSTCSDDGMSFLQIQTSSRKKGWVREAYCTAVQ